MREFKNVFFCFAILLAFNCCKPARDGISEELNSPSKGQHESPKSLTPEGTDYFINLMSNFNDGKPIWSEHPSSRLKKSMEVYFWKDKHNEVFAVDPSFQGPITYPSLRKEMREKFEKFFKIVFGQEKNLPFRILRVSCEKVPTVKGEMDSCAISIQK